MVRKSYTPRTMRAYMSLTEISQYVEKCKAIEIKLENRYGKEHQIVLRDIYMGTGWYIGKYGAQRSELMRISKDNVIKMLDDYINRGFSTGSIIFMYGKSSKKVLEF